MKSARLATALLVALPVGLGSLGTAVAMTPPAPTPTSLVAKKDATGDVQTFQAVVNPAPPQTTVPARRNGDIVGARVNHTRSTVRVFLRFAELNPGGEQQVYTYRFATPKLSRTVFFRAFRGKYGPIDRASYWSGSAPEMYGPAGNRRACAGMTRTIDYRANTALLVIPRTCLGYPSQVMVGSRLTIVTNYQSGYFDDAFGKGGSYRDPSPYGPPASHPGSF